MTCFLSKSWTIHLFSCSKKQGMTFSINESTHKRCVNWNSAAVTGLYTNLLFYFNFVQGIPPYICDVAHLFFNVLNSPSVFLPSFLCLFLFSDYPVTFHKDCFFLYILKMLPLSLDNTSVSLSTTAWFHILPICSKLALSLTHKCLMSLSICSL